MNLRSVRKRLGVTQEELATRINMSRTTISKYESGQIQPTFAQIKEIADKLGVSVLELLPNAVSDAMKERSKQQFRSDIAERKERKNALLSAYENLNPEGQAEAVKRVDELTQIPKYQRTSPQESLVDDEQTEDTPE